MPTRSNPVRSVSSGQKKLPALMAQVVVAAVVLARSVDNDAATIEDIRQQTAKRVAAFKVGFKVYILAF